VWRSFKELYFRTFQNLNLILSLKLPFVKLNSFQLLIFETFFKLNFEIDIVIEIVIEIAFEIHLDLLSRLILALIAMEILQNKTLLFSCEKERLADPEASGPLLQRK
jgi:hypothetical protein